MDRHFRDLLAHHMLQKRAVCVGLDPDIPKFPKHLHTGDPRELIITFLSEIVNATYDSVCAYKPNSAFFEMYGASGMEALKDVVDHIRIVAPDVPIILDAKRGDIGNTNRGYIACAFDYLGVDAITIQPYMGAEAVQPFLDRTDKGIFVLVKTSNHGSGEFQDIVVDGKPLYEIVARHVTDSWNANNNCGVVVGTTYPEDLRRVRAIVGDMPILMPGIGAQGGDVYAAVRAGRDFSGAGMIINSSRSILYASSGTDFADVARAKTQALDSEIKAALVE